MSISSSEACRVPWLIVAAMNLLLARSTRGNSNVLQSCWNASFLSRRMPMSRQWPHRAVLPKDFGHSRAASAAAGTQRVVEGLYEEDTSKYVRAAVSVVISRGYDPVSYLLIRRAKEPGKGKWSFPGGRIRLGETSVDAASRELEEETGIGPPDVQLYPHAICSSDAIYRESDGTISFQYVISQFHGKARPNCLPTPGSDASAVQWLSLKEIAELSSAGLLGGDITRIVRWTEKLETTGCLKNSWNQQPVV
eukprot:GHVS01025109.1.p1 GENE.GHVS01025109.1~~GHVS01025109.1.p1  ORF type:complete len:251 (+),score=19.73 GHVS01025109.1:215-967(+)